MQDFAAAAMMRVVSMGLARQGLAATPRPAPGTALVPLDHKRQLLEELLALHGPVVLLRLGESVLDAPDEPTLTALTQARDAPDLLARWQRLERFIHSRHRVVLHRMDAGGCCLQHLSLREGEPPTPAESLVVIGLLLALLQRIGTPALRARPNDAPTAAGWWHRDGRWCDDARAPLVACWDLAWQPLTLAPVQSPPHGVATVEAARDALAADCGAPWSVARLSTTLGLSSRTLQRRLADAGTTFSELWTEVRLAQSARMLVRGNEPPAVVGYHCGFSDQAHFTRSFKRQTAMTPAVYRVQFASAG